MVAGVNSAGRGGPPWRLIGWAVPVAVLLTPLMAGWPWTSSDYVVMGALLLIAGLLVELAAKASGDRAYHAGAALAVLAALLLVWVNLAVGFLGDEDNPANLMFAGVIGVAGLGAVLARLRAGGMARAMVAAAAAQLLAGVVGLAAGWSSPGSQGVYEVVMGTTLFGSLWLGAAALFRRSARRRALLGRGVAHH